MAHNEWVDHDDIIAATKSLIGTQVCAVLRSVETAADLS